METSVLKTLVRQAPFDGQGVSRTRAGLGCVAGRWIERWRRGRGCAFAAQPEEISARDRGAAGSLMSKLFELVLTLDRRLPKITAIDCSYPAEMAAWA